MSSGQVVVYPGNMEGLLAMKKELRLKRMVVDKAMNMVYEEERGYSMSQDYKDLQRERVLIIRKIVAIDELLKDY